MSELRLKIEEKYKNALKIKDDNSVKTLRLIKSAIKDKDISMRTEKNKEGLGEEGIFSLLQNLIKQRNESIEMYKKGNRENLAEIELKEIEVIKSLLPNQINSEELKSLIENTIKNENIQSIKDMGKLMKKLKSDHAGKIDMTVAGKLAKELIK